MSKQLDFDGSSNSRKTFFAEIMLPVPIPKLFTYRVPISMNELVGIGKRCIVQFGDRRIITGVIAHLHENPPTEYEAKYILDVLDDEPAILPVQLQLFNWIATYYLCSPGEVLNAALPAGLKLNSESMVQRHPAFSFETTLFEFNTKEELILKHLEQEPLSYSDISKLAETKTIFSILKSLVNKEAVIVYEEVREKYKPRTERCIRLHESYTTNKSLEDLFQQLTSKPKQEDVLLKYLHLVPVLQNPGSNKSGIRRKRLIDENISESSVNTLIKHGILEEFEIIVSRFDDDDEQNLPDVQLNGDQLQAEAEILSNFEKHDVTLLHGITGSGKTEIYISLIKKALAGGSQVLLLLPEIALTTQMVQRLRKVFGATLGVYHSRFSDNERVETWNGIISGKFKFIVGVRSSIFLPFDNLGLIIVDEEHDTSYKQYDPAPRYHARDVALVLAKLHHAKVLLGSATPAVETYYHAKQHKYGYVRLEKRYGDAQLPEIQIANLQQERKSKTLRGDFSKSLLTKIDTALQNKEQVILFQNRRGYSPMLQCEDCGWIPKCVNCAVSLTYHQYKHALVCHYCGYKENMPGQCPSCSSSRLKTVGYGTEKIEEEIKLHFPEAIIQRMDLDTTRSKSGYESIIEGFENGTTDILVGTQMVTKGLDFGKVSLVGVFNADRMLHFPDFRSYERAFQLLTQVSGRAGRRDKAGIVIIQTNQPQHPVLLHVIHHTLDEFYTLELQERERHAYPPFARLIEITLKHTDKKIVRNAAQQVANTLRQSLTQVRILGPGEPVVSKIKNQYLMNLLIKIPRNSGQLPAIKENILNVMQQIQQQKEYRTVRIVIDVDPA